MRLFLNKKFLILFTSIYASCLSADKVGTRLNFHSKFSNFTLSDDSSVLDINTSPNRGWDQFSVIKDSSSPSFAAETFTYEQASLDLITNNSNAIVALSDCCETVTTLVAENSEAILGLEDYVNTFTQLVVDNSYSVEQPDVTDLTNLTRDNSEAIVYLDECCETVTTLLAENSEAILGLEDYVNTFTQLIIDNSYSVEQPDVTDLTNLTRDNSAAIVYLDECCETVTTLLVENSEAIVGLEDYVNTFTQLVVDNSEAIEGIPQFDALTLVRDNSEAVVGLEDYINTFTQLVIDDSNAISEGISSDLVYQNSNAIVALSECCETVTTLLAENSEAIVGLEDYVNTFTQLVVDDSNAISEGISSDLVYQNSNAIVALSECCDTVTTLLAETSEAVVGLEDYVNTFTQLVVDNSGAILGLGALDLSVLTELAQDNSEAIVYLDECCDTVTTLVAENSEAIVGLEDYINTFTQLVADNSGAILGLGALDLSVLTELAQDNSEAIVYLDECCDTVTTLVAENSEAIVGLEDYVNTFTQLVVDDSNVISEGISSDLVYQNSNAIVALSECCETVTTLVAENSEAIIGLEDYVNTFTQLVVDDSNAISEGISSDLVYQNSNAIVALSECCETVTTLAADNSSAILGLGALDLSVLTELAQDNSEAIIGLGVLDLTDLTDLARDNSEAILHLDSAVDEFLLLIDSLSFLSSQLSDANLPGEIEKLWYEIRKLWANVKDVSMRETQRQQKERLQLGQGLVNVRPDPHGIPAAQHPDFRSTNYEDDLDLSGSSDLLMNEYDELMLKMLEEYLDKRKKIKLLSINKGERVIFSGENEIRNVECGINVEGDIVVLDECSLTFDFGKTHKNHIIYFDSDSKIELGLGASIKFKGSGLVLFNKGSKLLSNGLTKETVLKIDASKNKEFIVNHINLNLSSCEILDVNPELCVRLEKNDYLEFINKVI